MHILNWICQQIRSEFVQLFSLKNQGEKKKSKLFNNDSTKASANFYTEVNLWQFFLCGFFLLARNL